MDRIRRCGLPVGCHVQHIVGLSLGPWKFVLDMGSLIHSRLITAPGQEANQDNLGMYFDLL